VNQEKPNSIFAQRQMLTIIRFCGGVRFANVRMCSKLGLTDYSLEQISQFQQSRLYFKPGRIRAVAKHFALSFVFLCNDRGEI